MRGNVRVISNGSPKQLEAPLHAAGAIRITQEFTGEVRQEGMLRQVANGDKLALEQVERKAKLSAALNDPAKRSRDSYNIPGQHPVVKVKDGKVQASRSASQLLGKGLQGGSEEQRAKGVELLDAPSRRDAANAAKSQAGWLGIAPHREPGKGWELGYNSGQHGTTGEAVEGIAKVKLEHNFAMARSLGAPATPAPYAQQFRRRPGHPRQAGLATGRPAPHHEQLPLSTCQSNDAGPRQWQWGGWPLSVSTRSVLWCSDLWKLPYVI